MAFLYKTLVLVLLIAKSIAVLDLQDNAATCGPAIITTSHITTITMEKLITYSHSCYTKTVATPRRDAGCPNLAGCPQYIMCLAQKTTTAFVPPMDPCCPETPTKTVESPCETCGAGCATSTSTVFVTTTAPTPVVRREANDCTTTVWRSSTWATGATTTYHPLTETIISLVQCSGCSLVVSDLNGVGPVVSPTVTVTNTVPTVVTTYACQ